MSEILDGDPGPRRRRTSRPDASPRRRRPRGPVGLGRRVGRRGGRAGTGDRARGRGCVDRALPRRAAERAARGAPRADGARCHGMAPLAADRARRRLRPGWAGDVPEQRPDAGSSGAAGRRRRADHRHAAARGRIDLAGGARCCAHRWGRPSPQGRRRPGDRGPRIRHRHRFRPSTRSSAPATRGSPRRSGR